jgi:hypothetical protein
MDISVFIKELLKIRFILSIILYLTTYTPLVMEKLSFIWLLLSLLSFSLPTVSQEKYALLIGGPIEKHNAYRNYTPGWLPTEDHYEDMFWNDTFLMYEYLVQHAHYSPDNIKVLMDDGNNYLISGNYANRYKFSNGTPMNQQACIRAELVEALGDLKSNMTDKDFLFVFVFTHGLYTTAQDVSTYGFFCPIEIKEDNSYTAADYYLATEFAQKVNEIAAQKKVIWMNSCYSGGIADLFPQDNIVFSAACHWNQIAHEADNRTNDPDPFSVFIENETYIQNEGSYDCHHGEFIYHLYCALVGSTPTNNQIYSINPISNADNLPFDNVISVREAFNWEDLQESQHNSNNVSPEVPVYNCNNSVDIGLKTSLQYPNIVAGIGDLLLNENNIGIYGITSDVIIPSGQTLTFSGNSKIYLLNNSRIVVDGGATLHLDGGVSLYGNEQNLIDVENGNIIIDPYVSFNSRSANNVFGGLYLSGWATCSPLSFLTFNNAHLNNKCLDFSLSNSTFNGIQTADNNVCLYCEGGNVSLSTVFFNNGSAYFINPTKYFDRLVSISHCQFNQGNIDVEGYKNYSIENNSVQYNDEWGIIVSHAGNGTGTNESIYHNTLLNCALGVYINNSMASISSNSINNSDRGVYFANNSVTSFKGTPGLTQKVRNCIREEIFSDAGSFPVPFIYNEIIDEDNSNGIPPYPLLRYQDPTSNLVTLNVSNNCWGDNFNSNTDLVGGVNTAFVTNPIWCPYLPPPDPEDPPTDLLIYAKNQYDSGNYYVAKDAFTYIISQYPHTIQAQSCIGELFSVEQYAENDYSALQQYYLTNDSILLDSTLYKLSTYFANRCNERINNWSEEIAWFEERILNSESPSDSIFSILDLEYVYLLMNDTTNLKSTYVGNLQQYKPKSIKQYLPVRNSLLSLLPISRPSVDKMKNSNLGEIIKISPNPMKESANVFIKLNFTGNVKINIRDCYGRFRYSKTTDELIKGVNKVYFDNFDLPVGIYICSLEVNNCIQNSKKIVILD